MRALAACLVSLGALGCLRLAGAAGGFDSRLKTMGSENTIPSVFIVEFQPPEELSLQHRGVDLIEEFHAHLKRDGAIDPVDQVGNLLAGVQYTTCYEFRHEDLFHGVSLRLHDPADAAKLRSAPGVKAVYPARRYSLAAYTPKVAKSRAGASDAVAKQASPHLDAISHRSLAANDTFAPHVMARVDKLHAQGYTGAGIVVAVLDTGVDYTHPALNGGLPAGTPCFGRPECQIIGGTDVVGDDYTGFNDPVPDADPFADCPGSGHGTHTIGIVAARDVGRGFTGVAPDAKIKAVRVLGCGGDASDDVLIQGMIWAYNDGVDVMSISIGGVGGWDEEPVPTVSNRIAQKGVSMVWAMGNSGWYGAFAASSLGMGPASTTVGAVDNTGLVGYTIRTFNGTPSNGSLVMLNGTPWTFKASDSSTLPVVPVSTDMDSAGEACQPLPDTVDYTGKAVLVSRPPHELCSLDDALANILARGGKYVLVYSKPMPASTIYAYPDLPGQQVATLTRADGLALKAQYLANKQLALDLSTQLPTVVPDTQKGGTPADYSSTTPSWENDVYPALAAPGTNILSTYPVNQGSYLVDSGTSMATPFVAGSMALWKSIKGKTALSSAALRDRFTATATPLRQYVSSDVTESVAKQGGGLLDVYRAVYGTTTVSPGSISLNDSAHFAAGPHAITVVNTGSQAQTYDVTHLPAGTMAALNTSSNRMAEFPVPLLAGAAQVALSATSFTLAGGQSTTFTATFSPPAGLDSAQVPVYSGYIRIAAREDADLGSAQVPYMGVLADMARGAVLEAARGLPRLVDAAGDAVLDDTRVFTLAQKNGTTDAPGIAFSQRLGTAAVSVDLVLANTTFVATIPISDGQPPAQPALLHSPASSGGVPYSSVPTVGNVYANTWMPRDVDGAVQEQYLGARVSLANGTATPVADGQYRLLLRALRLFGDPHDEEAYDSYLTHAFTIRAAAQ